MMRSVSEELKIEVANRIKQSPLPKWMIPVISYRVYQDCHGWGEDEVNNGIIEWLDDFEEAFKKNE